MSLTSISSLTLLTSSTQSTSSSQTSAGKTLLKLIKDIQSGNLTEAQSLLTTLMKANSGSSASNPLNQLLKQLQTDLGNNDINAAKTDLNSFLNSSASSPTQTATSTTSTASATLNPTQSAFLSLLEDIQAGDTKSAQSDLTTLQGLLQTAAKTTTAVNAAADTKTTQDNINKLLAALQSSLANNDVAGARQQLSSFFQASDQSTGTLLSTNA